MAFDLSCFLSERVAENILLSALSNIFDISTNKVIVEPIPQDTGILNWKRIMHLHPLLVVGTDKLQGEFPLSLEITVIKDDLGSLRASDVLQKLSQHLDCSVLGYYSDGLPSHLALFHPNDKAQHVYIDTDMFPIQKIVKYSGFLKANDFSYIKWY